MIMICESISLAVSATLRPRFVDTLLLSFVAVVVVADVFNGADGATDVVEVFAMLDESLFGLSKG